MWNKTVVEMNFCRRCGKPLKKLAQHIYKCSAGHTLYLNPSPCVGILFMQPNGNVLLSVRGEEPNKGMLDAFGGFLDDSDESLESAAIRELREELSLEPTDYEPLQYVTSASTGYQYNGENPHLIGILFWTRLKDGVQPSPSDDVAAVQSHPLHTLDLGLLHSDDIRHGIRELRKLFPLELKEAYV
jgi:NAD+ diphosphatase